MSAPRLALVLLLVACGGGTAGAQQRGAVRRFAIDRDATIRVTNLVGSVRVTGCDCDSVVATSPLAEGTGTFTAAGRGRVAKVALEAGAAEGQPLLELRVPASATVWVQTVAGAIEVERVTGALELTSTGGRVRVDGAPRRLVVETIDGNVEVVGPAAAVRVRTGGGAIVLRGVTGEVAAASVGGPILVGGASIARGRLESVDGAIDFKGLVAATGGLDVETHGGAVELRVPPAMGADYVVATIGGRIRNQLQPSARAAAGQPLRFSTAGGGAAIAVRTFKGAVALLAQPQVLEVR